MSARNSGFAGHIHLEPALVADQRGQRFGHNGGNGGHAVGDAGLGAGGGEDLLGPRPHDARHADGRTAEGDGVIAAKETRVVRSGVESTLKNSGPEMDVLQITSVAQADLRLQLRLNCRDIQTRNAAPCAWRGRAESLKSAGKRVLRSIVAGSKPLNLLEACKRLRDFWRGTDREHLFNSGSGPRGRVLHNEQCHLR